MRNSEFSFSVGNVVRQGCFMSALLFSLTVDWLMQQATLDQPLGIRWTLFSTLEGLDFAEDLERWSHVLTSTCKRKPFVSAYLHSKWAWRSATRKQKWWCSMSQTPHQKNWTEKIFHQPRIYLLRLHCQARRRSRLRHQKSPHQGQEHFQNVEQRVEVIPVQHQDQAKTVPKLRTSHPTVRIRMLEDDLKRPPSTPRISEESISCSGQRPSPINTFLPAAAKTA